MTLATPEADPKRLIQVREKNYRAQEAEHQQQSPRSRVRQSPATDEATRRVDNTEQELPSADTAMGLVTTVLKVEKEPEAV